MIAVKGKRMFTTEAPPVPPVVLSVTFGSAAAGATASIPAFKYNKSRVLVIDWDDGNTAGYEDLKALALTYTDGCGNAVPLTGGVAINLNDPVTDAKKLEILAAGWDYMNHSTSHSDWTGIESVQGVHDQLMSQIAYKMAVGVVPTAFPGYLIGWKNFGYFAADTQNGNAYDWDGLGFFPDFGKSAIADMPVQHYYAIRRDFVDDWTDNYVPDIVSNLLTNAGSICIVGTHGFYQDSGGNTSRRDAFNTWINGLRTTHGDSLAVMSLREFIEYTFLRNYIPKTVSSASNVLSIALDYNAMPDNMSWKDLSFVLTGSQTITGATVDDPSFSVTFNPATRLINIKKRKTTWT